MPDATRLGSPRLSLPVVATKTGDPPRPAAVLTADPPLIGAGLVGLHAQPVSRRKEDEGQCL